MQEYLEQSVAGEASARGRVLYGLCWAGIALLLIAALVSAAGIFGSGARLDINWLNLILTLVFLALAWLVFRSKDRLCVEYDYTLRGDALEICTIWNNRRRKVLANIPLERVERFGSAKDAASGEPGLQIHHWNVHGAQNYLYYMEESQRHMAMLELNDEMVLAIRQSRKLRRDAWRGGEGSYK